MDSRFFVVTSGYRAEQGELGDRQVVLVELSKEMFEIKAMLMPDTNKGEYKIRFVSTSDIVLILAGFAYVLVSGYSEDIKYGPHAWEKDSLEEARGFALYRCDYPGSQETCQYREVVMS